MKKIICFIHIERAGGTSLHHLLHYKFDNYKTISPRNLYTNTKEAYFRKENLKKLLSLYPKLEGIGGHTVRSFLNYYEISKYPFFYFTFLREPISRYMSHFNYQRQVMNINWDIKDFINEKYFNNFQTKKIIGKENVELAYKEIQKYSFVGLTENYNESLLLLGNKISWINFNPLYEKKNEIPSKQKNICVDNLSTKIQKQIIENNKIDIELYNAVKKTIYQKQKQDYPGNLKLDLEIFENNLKNFKYSKVKSYYIKFKKAKFKFLDEKKLYR